MTEERMPQHIPDPADIFVSATEKLVTGYERLSKKEMHFEGTINTKRVRTAIKRSRAQEHLFLLLMSLGATIGLTRLFLALTGYPQIGNAELHIAHVLWGGLGVFIGAILMLVLSNPWVYSVSAIFTGIGMGLFIDEVGKFITQSNDYFYPAAAPVIYVVFLLTTWLYLRIRRPPSENPRAVMYRVLEGLCEMLDHDLEEREVAAMYDKLVYVEAQAQNRDIARLAHAIRSTLSSEDIQISETQNTILDRWRTARDQFMDRWVPKKLHRTFAGFGLFAMGYLALRTPLQLIRFAPTPTSVERIVGDVLNRGVVQIPSSAGLFSLWISLEAAIGVALWVAAAILLFERERLGVFLGQRALVVYLAFVNIFVFYFQQFSWVPFVLIQFFLLWVLKSYKLRGFL